MDDLDPSIAFTTLLQLSSDFRALTSERGCKVTAALVRDYNQAGRPGIWMEFTRQWLADHTDLNAVAAAAAAS